MDRRLTIFCDEFGIPQLDFYLHFYAILGLPIDSGAFRLIRNSLALVGRMELQMKKHCVLGLIGRQRGFTLGELLIALVILSILAAVAIPMFGSNGPNCDNADARQGPLMRAKIGKVTGDIGQIHIEATQFVLSTNRYPNDLAEIGLDGLEDPWGNPYQYLLVEGLNNVGAVRKDYNLKPVNSYYDVYSMGPDGVTASPFTSTLGKDDIVMASDGGYFGLACQYDGSGKGP